jgi:hypothetical protein
MVAQQQEPAMPAAMPSWPPPPAAAPGWAPGVISQRPPRDATPTAQDAYDRPLYPVRPSVPQVAGFGPARKSAFRPWMLLIGALVMAIVAFLITRMFLR